MDKGNEDLAYAEEVSAENGAAENEEHQAPQTELLKKELQIRRSILDCNPEPDSSSEPGTEEVVLFENYEDYLASVAGEEQRNPEITLDTASGYVAKVESRDEPASEEVALLREQLELSEARLQQQENKQNEDIKFY